MRKLKTFNQQGHAKRGGRSLLAAALAAIVAGGSYAQDTIEEIVVTGTGTSIRGEAPVGQNLISIGREAIQESGAVSVQQILNDVPQITGFGNAAQGAYGSADGSGTYSPTIHSLGASASNSTLTLVNGHRLPLSGVSHTLADPSIIPPAALERVEVLPDGASATYGSDAVAGVLNFITRTDVEGVEISAQTGFADNYRTANLNFVTGTNYGEGSVTAAYAYSYRSALANADRPNIRSDLRDQGGRNFLGNNCAPATMVIGGVRYKAPYGPTDIVTEAECDQRAYSDLIPSERRHSLFLGWQHDFSDALSFQGEMVMSERYNHQDVSRGTLSATATSANPYFVDPTGTGATSATINWDSNELLGPGAKGIGKQKVYYVAGGLEYDFGNDWFVSAKGVFGRDTATELDFKELCSSCAEDALDNTDPATALNVWGAAGTAAAGGASMSDATRLYLEDSNYEERSIQGLTDLIVKIDGTLMALPAGDMKVAFGANRIQYDIDQVERGPGPDGGASTNALTMDNSMSRTVNAVFAEALIPITERISFSAAVRTDDYSDFGSTTNPRLAVQWYVNDYFKVRASWAESFVAPALTSRGMEGTGRTTESGVGTNGNDGFIPEGFSDPQTGQFLDWVEANYPGNCEYEGTTRLGCNVGVGGLNAARTTGGNPDLVAATGKTWSIGVDLTSPDWLPGLRANITYYDALLNQMVTAPTLTNIINVPGLNNRIILLPTQAEWDDWAAGLPQSGALPVHPNLPAGAAFGYAWSFQQINAFNIDSAGIDFELSYIWDTDIGSFTASYSGNKKTRFDQQAGTGGPWIDYLNVDANTTFSSLEYLSNASLQWERDNMNAKLTWKHQNEYDGLGTARSQTVDAFNTFNFYGSYNFDEAGMFGDSQVFLQVQNLLDEEPPFVDTNGGYNSSDSSPLGRMLTVGFRKTF